MNPTTQNLSNPTIYSQLDTTYNISSDANPDNMSQKSTSASVTTSLIMPFDINENQPMQQASSPNLYTRATITNYSLQSIQEFFYRPYNDFQMYHVICKEIPLSFELVSQLINDSTHDYVQPNDIYVFYHEQTDSKKIYQITCKMVSHQFLNKMIYGIEFIQYEQQQKFSKN